MQKQGLPFVCSITSQIYVDPWLAEDGQTYEKYAIEAWIKQKKSSTITGQKLNMAQLRQNKAVKEIMDAFHAKDKRTQNQPYLQEIIMSFTCPLKRTIFRDPVTTIDGFTYERKAIQRYFRISDNSPITNMLLKNKSLVPNKGIKKLYSLFTTQDNKKLNNLKKSEKQFYKFFLPQNFDTVRIQLQILNPQEKEDVEIQIQWEKPVIKQIKQEPIMRERKNAQTVALQCDNFVQRPQINEKIVQALQKNRVICLIGQAGVGKSQLALNYLKNQSEYNVTLINCSSAFNFMSSVQNQLGNAVHIKKNTQLLLKQFYSLFDSKCIILLDDVENQNMLKQFLPNRDIEPKILMTSRSKKWDCETIEVSPFSNDEATEYVKKFTSDRQEYKKAQKDVSILNQMIGGIPLALFQAMTYIKHKKYMPIQQYCAEFKKNQAEMLDKLKGDSSSKNIYTNLLMTILSLKKQNNLAQLVLIPLAYMPPLNIDREQAIQFLKFINKDGEFTVTKLKKVKQVFKKLHQDYSLLQKVNQNKEVYKINSLVQSVIRLTHKKQGFYEDHITSYINWIKIKLKQLRNKPRQIIKQRVAQVIDQLIAVSNIEIESMTLFQQLIKLFAMFYQYSLAIMNHNQSKICYMAIKKLSLNKFGKSNALTQLANYFQSFDEINSGNLDQGLKLLQQQTKQFDQFLNKQFEDGPIRQYDIKACKHVLTGIALQQKGLNQQSILQFKKAQAIYLKFCPNDQLRLQSVYKYMAQAYGGLGQLQKHRDMLEKALSVEEKHFGKNHPSVARIMTNLALVYGSFQLYEKQKSMFQRCLEIQYEVYSEMNVDICLTLQGLATAQGNLQNQQKKKTLLEQVIKFKQQNYPPNHMQILQPKVNYANCLQALGKVTEAKELFELLIPVFKLQCGQEHELTCQCLANYANALLSYGDKKKAQKLCNSVLKIMKKKGDHENCDAIRISTNVLHKLKAEENIFQVKNIDKRQAQANYYIENNINVQKGIRMLEQIVRVVIKYMGQNDKSLIATYINLSVGYGRIGNIEKKKDLLIKSLKIHDNNNGQNDENLGNIWHNLGNTYSQLELQQKSLQAYHNASDIFHDCLGPNDMKTIHVDQIITSKQLANMSLQEITGMSMQDQLKLVHNMFRSYQTK